MAETGRDHGRTYGLGEKPGEVLGMQPGEPGWLDLPGCRRRASQWLPVARVDPARLRSRGLTAGVLLPASLLLLAGFLGSGSTLQAQEPGTAFPPMAEGYPGQQPAAASTAEGASGSSSVSASAPGASVPFSAGTGATGAESAGAAGDPPSRVVRLSALQGNVSAEPAGVNSFSPAELNGVLTAGDRIYTDTAAEAELQTGGIAVRLGGGADLTVTAMTDTLGQFGLAAGTAHLRSFTLDPGTVLELDSPEAAVTVLGPGDVRVEVDPRAHTTTVTLLSGQVQVDGLGSSQVLSPGQAVRLHGGDLDGGQAAYAEPLAPAAPDALDGFSDARDSLYASGTDAASPYVNADTVGGADLAAYGGWDTSDLGPVWFPVVAVDWQPYRFGHWRWIAPWGWTWVGAEPWGFAPFHYGRWAFLNSRWGWIPGSPVVRPVYAPALVAFAGGAQFSASLGYAPGLGIAAWFPLGAREPYIPPYGGSTLYLNRVNASNLYNPNAAEVRGFYNQRAVNVFTGTPAANRVYANRLVGTVAVPQTSFAAGLGVNHASLHLDAAALAAAPLIAHPLVTPERSMLIPGAPRALPPVLERPVLAGIAAPAGNEPAGAVLFHRAQPPATRPSFDQQREAMEGLEPGRPLTPAQLETLRPSHREGAPGTREVVSRPAPPRSTAEPAKPAPAASPGTTHLH